MNNVMINYATARAIREILEDMKNGVVPEHVSTFSELHDYVDANEYGGLCEDGYWCLPDDATDAEIEANDWMYLKHPHESNAVQDQVHKWLQERFISLMHVGY